MQIINNLIEFGFSFSLLVNALLFIPQILSLLRYKSAEGVSLITFVGFNVIQLFILLHGLINQDYILVLGYLLSLITCGTVSFLIIYYKYLKANDKK